MTCYSVQARDKHQNLNANPKAKQKIDFTGNLDRAEDSTMFFIIKEAKQF